MILSPKRKLLRILAVLVIFAAILIISGCVENKSKELPKNYTNSLGMEFVLIPAGEYQMGSPSYSGKLFDTDSPVHNVTIQKPFYMSKYEVTQKEWTEIAPYNPSQFKGDNLPVENVSWPEIRSYILKLNLKEKVKDSEKYRLPTEAEWEYACRAGTTTRFSFGDENKDLDEYGWSANNSNDTTHPVGLKYPNQWGLYDMHGNVWELTQDSWHDRYNGAPSDGSAWLDKNATKFVGRGGSWLDGPNLCASSFRGSNAVNA
ncbi:MAG: hypothetical protein QG646_1993, partial [Euryarchaeota archaeon]|nr:hypothetical protein [Euryarchaeota archaeon]